MSKPNTVIQRLQKVSWRLYCTVGFLFICASVRGQIIPKIVGVEWFTVETDHFRFHYHEGTEPSVASLLSFADDVYASVTALHHIALQKKVDVVVIDYRDATNGFAISSMDLMSIETTPLYFNTFNLRGRSNWLRNVFTHEFSHIVSLKSIALVGDRMATYTTRPVLNQHLSGINGVNPNTDIFATFPIPDRVNPYWWVEGIAQHDTETVGNDYWDSHRDMFLRMATLEDNLLTFEQMSVKPVLKEPYGELGYCQGFSLSRYLSSHFGRDIHAKLSKHHGDHANFSWERSMREVFDQEALAIYESWKRDIESRYIGVAQAVGADRYEGEKLIFESDRGNEDIEKRVGALTVLEPASTAQGVAIIRRRDAEKERYKSDGIYNIYVEVSPDGKWISYIRDRSLTIRDQKTFEEIVTIDDVSSYSWAPDGNRMVVSVVDRHSKFYQRGLQYHSLAIVDLVPLLNGTYDTPEYQFITTPDLRAEEPNWSPDGEKIAFVSNQRGQKTLAIIDLSSGDIRLHSLTRAVEDQVAAPSFSPDSKRLAFVFFHNDHQNLSVLDLKSGGVTPITHGESDDRDPHWFSDDKVLFSSDRSGIFNLYIKDIINGAVVQISNVLGGAFMGHYNSGKVYYSNFSSFGFKPFVLAVDGYAKTIDRGISEGDHTESATQLMEISSQRNGSAELSQVAKVHGEPFHLLGLFPKHFIPFQIIPQMWIFGNQLGLGAAVVFEDLVSHHKLRTRFLLDEDQIFSIDYINNSWYPTIALRYAKSVNKLIGTYRDAFFDILDVPEGTTAGYYAEISQDIISGEVKYFYRKSSQEGFRIGGAYSYRLLSAKTATANMGADAVDTRFENGFDANGDWGDYGAFRLLRNNGFDLMMAYLEDISLAKEIVSTKDDNDINPRGYGIVFRYAFVYSELEEAIQSYGILFGPIDPNEPQSDYSFNAFRLDGTIAFASPLHEDHSVQLTGNISVIDQNVSPNDEFYLGGKSLFATFRDINNSYAFPGYPQFSITGETRVIANAVYRVPLVTDLKRGNSVWFVDDVMLSIFGDIGNAWDYGKTYNRDQSICVNSLGEVVMCGATPKGDVIGKGPVFLADVGITLAVKSFLFYMHPWHSFLTVAHGFHDQAKYGFSDSDLPIRMYIGIGGGF